MSDDLAGREQGRVMGPAFLDDGLQLLIGKRVELLFVVIAQTQILHGPSP